MTKPGPTRAEQLRRHREIFLHAREHNLTLREAEKALARAEWEAAQARLRITQLCGRRQGKSVFVEALHKMAVDAGLRVIRPLPDDAPWMMRD